MANFECFGHSRLNTFVAPLYMEPIRTQVFCYNREGHSRPNPGDLCRPGFDFDHACWPVRPAPSWLRHVWSDPHPLETGAVAVLSGRDSYN